MSAEFSQNSATVHVETERRERQRLFLFVFDCVAPACAQFNAGFDTDRQISWVTLGVCHPALFRHNRNAGETADCSVVVYADNHGKKKRKKRVLVMAKSSKLRKF